MDNKLFTLLTGLLIFVIYKYLPQIEIVMGIAAVLGIGVSIVAAGGAIVYGIYWLKTSVETMQLKTQALAVANAMASQSNIVLSHDQVLMTNNPNIALADTSYFTPITSRAGIKALPMPDVSMDNDHVDNDAPLDLITVMTSSPNQVYAIIGGQQSGKTWQAHHVLWAWKEKGADTMVIAPKWDVDEWTFVDKKFGGGGDWQSVGEGLDELQREIAARHANTAVSHKSHKVLVCVIDDVTPLVQNVDNFEDFIMTATTLSASVNVVIIFLIHADTRDAWGVGTKGKALTGTFVKLFISPTYTKAGELVKGGASGMVCFNGERVGKPVTLLNTPKPMASNNVTPIVTPTASNVTAGLTFVTSKFNYDTWLLQHPVTSELGRSQRLGRLLSLVSNDMTDLSQLVKACYSEDGSKQRNLVRTMLAELGYVCEGNKVQILAK